MSQSSIYSFDTVEEAIGPLKEHLKQGDLVLVKGSHAMELSKVVDAIKYREPSSSSPA